jgi:hypothetical protein
MSVRRFFLCFIIIIFLTGPLLDGLRIPWGLNKNKKKKYVNNMLLNYFFSVETGIGLCLFF